MKHSIRTRFTLGMIFIFVIISVLAVFSGFYLNKLSAKTSAILKENFLSVVYAREMTEGLMNINQEITTCFLTKRIPDTLKISKELKQINLSLGSEMKNITEPGEDKLVSGIETNYIEYRDSMQTYVKSSKSAEGQLYLQNKSAYLYQQLSILSQMNGKALEVKTDDAKNFSQSALTKMTILATMCFLIGMSFTFSFASYFNRRFFQLYHGLKEIVASGFEHRLYFDGNDEFHEISLVVNEMADNLKKNKQKMSVTLQKENLKDISTDDIEELKKMLFRLKTTEEQAAALISKLENK
jgi:two-component system, NtrC family, sensor histidine kinase KinB